MEWTIPAFAFPAEAGIHLPTQEGWKAELALGGWLVTYRNKCPAPGIEPGHLYLYRWTEFEPQYVELSQMS